jgi:hypothetical protein
VGASGFEVMSRRASIGDSIVGDLGWGTATCIVDIMCIAYSIIGVYILLGRPSLSVGTGVGFVDIFLGAAHGVVPRCLWLMVWERGPAAGVARMVVVDVATMRPTVV